MSHGDEIGSENKFNTKGINHASTYDTKDNNEITSTIMSRSENNSTSSNSSSDSKHVNNNRADTSTIITTSPSASQNNSLIKTSHRTKLSTQDIKLILYLIVHIKPFKYVGDRKISQTRKWELIQSRYEEIKKSEATNNILVNVHDEIIVPTVRTLQRQLANAIKKAKLRRGGSNSHDIGRVPGKYLFNSITRKSTISELELALLELYESSEQLKNGKGSNSNNNSSYNVNLVSINDQFIHSGIPNYSKDYKSGSSTDRIADEEADLNIEMEIEAKVDNLNNHERFLSSNIDCEIALKNIGDTRKSILEELNQNQTKSMSEILPLLNELINQSTKYQLEQDKLFDHNMKLISMQYDNFKKFIELNKSIILKENQLNKDILSKIVEEFSQDDTKSISAVSISQSSSYNGTTSNPSVTTSEDKPKESSTNKNRILKSLQELLN